MTRTDKHSILYKNKLRILISISFLVLSIIILFSIFFIVNKVGKPLLYEENNQLLEQYGNKVVAILGEKELMIESLTSSIANLGESMNYNFNAYKNIVPHIINLEGYDNLIAGGGIWPEPFVFNSNVERRSFFWGKDSDNKLIYYDNYNSPEGKGYHHEEWYVPLKYIHSDLPFWSKSYMDPYSFQSMVTCTVPMWKNGVFQGVATIDLRLEGLNSLLQDAIENSGGYAYALDRNNKLLSFPDGVHAKSISVDSIGNITQEFLYISDLAQKEPLFKPIADYLNKLNENIISLAEKDSRFKEQIPTRIDNDSYQINAQEAKLITAIMLDPLKDKTKYTKELSRFYSNDDIFLHEPVIISVFHMPRTYWKIVIVTPYQKSVAIINRISQKLIFIFSIVLLILLIAVYLLFMTKILIPLRKLSLQLKEIAHTPLDRANLIKYKENNEIGELVYWLNKRTTELQHSTKALRENEEKYRSIFENTGTASVIINEDTTIVLVNDEFVHKSGYSKEEMEGKMSWLEFALPEDREKLRRYHHLCRENPTKVLKSYESKFVDRRGEIYDVYINKEMLPDKKTSIASLWDITKRKHAEVELKKAKNRAEENDRLKTVFLQNISHEIRTPLNAISGFSSLLTDRNLPDDQHDFYLQIIQSNSDQLVSIVTDILTISSLVTKQEKINVSKICLNIIITELYAVFQEQVQNTEILLLVKSQMMECKTCVYTDRTKLTQILVNLLSNAIKYTNRGTVEFGYQVKDGVVEFYVQDTGIGIPSEYHEMIFERFGQVEKQGSKIYRGTGLGLSISKGFVDLLGGKIWVESVPGKGSTFYFTIPNKVN